MVERDAQRPSFKLRIVRELEGGPGLPRRCTPRSDGSGGVGGGRVLIWEVVKQSKVMRQWPR